MNCTQIFSDSSCDLPESLVKQHNIKIIPFYISFNQKDYLKEKIDISINDFYEELENKTSFPKTSLPSVQDYMDVFIPHLDAGQDILCFCLSSHFSGSYQSAVNAKNILLEQYPDSKIKIINSLQATAGQGLLVLEACRLKALDMDIETICNHIESVKPNSGITFTVDTLEHLQRGGRIGKASSLIGNVLNVKPLICLINGELVPFGKTRGRKKSIKQLVSMIASNLENTDFDDYHFAIAHAMCPDDAQTVKELLEKNLDIKTPLPFFQIGTTIGTNTGSSTLGIAYLKKANTSNC